MHMSEYKWELDQTLPAGSLTIKHTWHAFKLMSGGGVQLWEQL